MTNPAEQPAATTDDQAAAPSRPLCVDLDGTLVATDTLWELLLKLIRRQPIYVLMLPLWLRGGRAFFKAQLARRVSLDATTLPYRKSVLDFAREQKAAGRRVILATASDQRVARDVADHLGAFDDVVASDSRNNCGGAAKVKAINERCGGGFDYIGDSAKDLPVWEAATECYAVEPSPSLLRRLRAICPSATVFFVTTPGRGPIAGLVKAMRPVQWLKNILLAVPIIMGHVLTEWSVWGALIAAIVSFSLCASAVYIINDLFDLEPDRHHPTKRGRPFASGQTPIPYGIVGAAVSLTLGFTIALCWLPFTFAQVLVFYLVLTTTYTLALKRINMLDAIVLAGLYTLRLAAGGVAVGDNVNVLPSEWLLAFSMFFFVCLAFAKRYSELRRLSDEEATHARGRGYQVVDLEAVGISGLVSGYLSVLVFILYVTDPNGHVDELYGNPTILLLACPILLYWISRLWLLARRGDLHEDPVIFTLTDRVSYICGWVLLILLFLADAKPGALLGTG